MLFPLTVVIIILLILILIKGHIKQWDNCSKCKNCKYCKTLKRHKIFDDIKKERTKKKERTRAKCPECPIFDTHTSELSPGSKAQLRQIPTNNKTVHHGVTDDQIDQLMSERMNDEQKSDSYIADQRSSKLRESINKLYMDSMCPGDSRLYKKMQHMSFKNKRAIEARAKFDRNSLLPWVAQELVDNENKVWWESEVNAV